MMKLTLSNIKELKKDFKKIICEYAFRQTLAETDHPTD